MGKLSVLSTHTQTLSKLKSYSHNLFKYCITIPLRVVEWRIHGLVSYSMSREERSGALRCSLVWPWQAVGGTHTGAALSTENNSHSARIVASLWDPTVANRCCEGWAPRTFGVTEDGGWCSMSRLSRGWTLHDRDDPQRALCVYQYVWECVCVCMHNIMCTRVLWGRIMIAKSTSKLIYTTADIHIIEEPIHSYYATAIL